MKNKYKEFFDLLDQRGTDYTITLNGEIHVTEFNLSIGDKINNLPDNLKTDYDLSLTGCTKLTNLPKNLIVGGDLLLTNCTGIRSLPIDMVVQGSLFLSGCKLYPFDPKTLQVRGKIFGIYKIIPNSVRFITDEN